MTRYGDLYPESAAGKIFGSMCAISGVIIRFTTLLNIRSLLNLLKHILKFIIKKKKLGHFNSNAGWSDFKQIQLFLHV